MPSVVYLWLLLFTHEQTQMFLLLTDEFCLGLYMNHLKTSVISKKNCQKMKIIKIPQRYQHPMVVAALLRSHVEEWSQRSLRHCLRRGKLRDPDLEARYFQLEREFSTLDDFCSRVPFKFIIKIGDNVKIIGRGPEILWDDDKNSIVFDKFHMYPIPRGIKNKHVYVTDFVAEAGLTDRHWDPTEWDGDLLDMEAVLFLERLFRIKIQIWNQNYSLSEHRAIYDQEYIGSIISEKEYYLHHQEKTGYLLMIDEPEKYFDKYFLCTNENCFYTFRSQKQLDQHTQLCGLDNTRILQEELGQSGKLVKKAEDRGLIPKVGYNRNFLFYDIESTLPSSDVCTQRTKVLQTHQLVSIAANR